MKAVKRYLYLFHRWSGIVLSLLFGLWFASGFVMMYVGYPELSPAEKFSGLSPLSSNTVRIAPAQALSAAGVSSSPERLLLSTVLGRPAYRIFSRDGRIATVFADDGTLLERLTEAEALKAAENFSGGADAAYLHTVTSDQWTLSSSLNPLRPLHLVRLDDGRGTELYISDSTGVVARDTDRRERFWNWTGTTIHWLYPAVLRRHGELWADVVIWLSLAGTLSALSGIIIGTLRLRLRKRYSRGRTTPYSGVQRLHHLLGMGIGIFVLMFVFSGLLSMNPWGLFDSGTSFSRQLAEFRGAPLDPEALVPLPADLSARLPQGASPREIEWRNVGGDPYLVLTETPDRQYSLPLSATAPALETAVAGAARRLIPEANIAASELLLEYDSWYYSHHHSHRPLPVLRVKFDDAESTWFHLNPASGEVQNRLTRADRWERWLYNGMHSLDFPFLINNRPLWDIIVLLLSVAGLLFCITSVIIGWRRLRQSAGFA